MAQESEVRFIVMAIFVVITIAWLAYSTFKISSFKEKLQIADTNIRGKQAIIEQLEKKLKPITDIEALASELEGEARTALEKAKFEASGIVSAANRDSERIRREANKSAENTKSEANQYADKLTTQAKQNDAAKKEALREGREKAHNMLETAREESSRIIDVAKQHAEEIAGDAYQAKQQADSLESAITAMKNTIQGYRDDYIIPNASVLDDLAEDYSHKQAGEELKQARKRVRDMVKGGYAGQCDYVEFNRKTYAIHFAVDAFNGKVASALAKVKHDNLGKIKQEIVDAYALVNHNGKPFRNARITPEFLEARLEELKWAVATHELRQNELAEQKAIREQMREEEKARREMERAIKESQKEERMLQKALEKARKELAGAHAEQREQYEQQIADLEVKLQEADEKGQRALSMAQQTKRGHVYVISNVGSFGENIFKIGLTRRLEPMDRVKELGDASVPFSFDVHAMIYSEDAPALEKALHRKFERESVNKVNPRKEFFNTSIAEIRQVVEQGNEEEIHWTMKAEAAEYRESLAIAQQLEEAVA